MAPENIITVLGSRDTVTPYASGKALIDDWRVPAENRFIWRRGHFSVPLRMIRDDAPLIRLRDLLERLRDFEIASPDRRRKVVGPAGLEPATTPL